MEANAKSFEVVVHAKRTPKRNADVLEEASSAAKEVVASWSSTWSSTWSPKFGTRKKGGVCIFQKSAWRTILL